MFNMTSADVRRSTHNDDTAPWLPPLPQSHVTYRAIDSLARANIECSWKTCAALQGMATAAATAARGGAS